MILRRILGSALLVMGMSACGENGTGPDDGGVSLAVQSGDAQFGAPNQTVLDPLQVIVTDPVSEEPVENTTVTWTVTVGSGAQVTPSSTTDENGVATATLRLGSALGNYEVQARATKMVGNPARFVARAVNPPTISNAPQQTDVGDTITITGTNFSTQPDDNIVLFGGFRGKVITATATTLRVAVPVCVPARTVQLTASLGAVSSPPVTIQVNGSTTTALQLARGDVRTITDPAELGCFQLPGTTGYAVVLIPQNATDVAGRLLPLQLAGLTGGTVATSIATSRVLTPSTDVPHSFEAKLRSRERALVEQASDVALRPQASASAAACPSPPALGNRCDFKVINKDDDFVNVTAELKAISTRALIYQDLNAPANGLSPSDFQTLGATFDDPIYAAVSGAFGTPSDIDSNGKIIILLTPIVNELTPRTGGSGSGFIAGFFYGCDLVSAQVCSGTNRAEVFYTLTADPTGQFSNARSVSSVLSSLPAVLAHEFQHMISFGQRQTVDALWLSEGLAHHAEDVVADAYAARNDALNAERFRGQNRLRADRYLRDPAATSLIAEGGTGTLELRGAAWLFVKYLAGQYGAPILRSLTLASQSSVTNVTQQTGRAWSALLANWAVALIADDAPELAGATLRPEHTYPNVNLRAFMGGSTYSLRPLVEQFADFTYRATLPAASQEYIRVQASGATATPLNLNLAGLFGGSFAANASPQLSILRLQ